MKKVLITGGSGFIGSNIALKLIDMNYQVTILDCLSQQIHGSNPDKTSPLYNKIKDNVNFIRGSVTSKEDWLSAIQDQDSIIHLAAETGTGQSMYEIKKYVDVNIGGTALMLDILTNEKHTVRKIVVASSRAIYGEGRYLSKEKGFVYPLARNENDMRLGDFECKYDGSSTLQLTSTDEDSIIHPTSLYGITKQVQEQLVMTLSPSIGISPVALRYQNVYGPGQSLTNPYTGILSIFSTRILNSNSINIFEDGKESRDFIFIDDVVDATILALESNNANGKIFNVGSGKPTSVLIIAKLLAEQLKCNVPIEISGNYRVGDIRHNYADIGKAKNILNFYPRWDIEKGIKKFAEWVNNQEISEDKYEESIKQMKEKGLYK